MDKSGGGSDTPEVVDGGGLTDEVLNNHPIVQACKMLVREMATNGTHAGALKIQMANSNSPELRIPATVAVGLVGQADVLLEFAVGEIKENMVEVVSQLPEAH